MRTGLRTNNKGFSLVEMIITLAVMSILGIGIVSIAGIISTAKVNSCAQSIGAALNRVKTNTLAKDDGAYFEIYEADDSIYILEKVNGKDPEIKEIGNANIASVSFKDTESATPADLDTTHLRCEFSRPSGGVKASDFYSLTVRKKSGGGSITEITVHPGTGKIEIKKS